MHQILTPGVQYGQNANARTEMLRVRGDRHQRLRRRAEQNVVDGLLVLQGKRSDFIGKREDNVEVVDREDLRCAGFRPLPPCAALAFGTMPVPAGIVGDPLVGTPVAPLHMPPEGLGAAMRDVMEDAALGRR